MSKCTSYDTDVYGGVCCCDDHAGEWVGDCAVFGERSGFSGVADWWAGLNNAS